jgi:hypothetical protein
LLDRLFTKPVKNMAGKSKTAKIAMDSCGISAED